MIYFAYSDSISKKARQVAFPGSELSNSRTLVYEYLLRVINMNHSLSVLNATRYIQCLQFISEIDTGRISKLDVFGKVE